MSNVVSFAAFKNDRRASAEIAKREEAKAAKLEQERREIADSLGGTAGAHIIADVLTGLKAKDAEANAPKYTPAYCDPTNEVRGSKYEATKGLYGADLAKRIRQDIKDAQKAGTIPAGFKISVRTDSYSGGYSIDVRVTAVPAEFKILSDKMASWKKQFPNSYRNVPLSRDDMYSDEYNALIANLKAIHGAYNRDNSDSMVDYFDTRYYGDVGFDWRVRDQIEARDVEASAGDVWHEDSAR